MSNPLLKPDDRFQPRQIVQADGTNPFAEGDAVLEAEAVAPERSGNTFAAPAASDELPFRPQYEMTADHRGGTLLILSLFTLGGACLGPFVSWIGFLLPLLAIVPAATVIFLAADDLKMMRLGGRNRDGWAMTLAALIICTVLLVGLIAMIALFIYWGWQLIPEWML
jgi:hypothetical protein